MGKNACLQNINEYICTAPSSIFFFMRSGGVGIVGIKLSMLLSCIREWSDVIEFMIPRFDGVDIEIVSDTIWSETLFSSWFDSL